VPLDGPEVFVGIVGPVGADLDFVCSLLTDALVRVGYISGPVRLIELLYEFEEWASLPRAPLDLRIESHIRAGNEFCGKLKREDALALLAVKKIRRYRVDTYGSGSKSVPRQAYILRSLKRPGEAEALRRIYGRSFVLVGAYSPRSTRVQNLASLIAKDHHVFATEECRTKAEELILRDQQEPGKEFGQNLSETFPMADVFINVEDPACAKEALDRFVELLFGYPFHTPSRDEYGMFHSQAAAYRSACLARQVGAAICTADGDVVAVGTNDVPKAGGGLYWSDSRPDHRDFTLGEDSSDKIRRNILADTLDRLNRAGWLAGGKSKEEIDKLVDLALTDGESPLLRGAQLMNVLVGRSVHAEMAAITDAARRGVKIEGCTLYTTTFPCHDCARHIVAAGIRRVVYIEPYPKSLCSELHPDSIAVDNPSEAGGRVSFEPFVGVAPRQFMDMFEMVKRKEEDGKVVVWNRFSAVPRRAEQFSVYNNKELAETTSLQGALIKQRLMEAGREE